MPAPYAATIRTGSQSIDTNAVQLTSPVEATYGQIIEALLSSSVAWSYSSDSGGTFITAPQNPANSLYEVTLSVAKLFDQIWVKSSVGTITLNWRCLLNYRA